jgi:hypothetical protein
VQKKISRVKTILVILLLSFLLTANKGISQAPAAKETAAKELKRLWKKNEVVFGVGSALLFTLVVYALWRKKKRGISNIDSIT